MKQKECDHCHEEFSAWIKIDGKWRNLNSRRYCLKCSPFGSRRTRPIGSTTHSVPLSKQPSYITQRRREKKKRCIDYKGGKCQICGYDRCHRALEFHHINPADKLMDISYGTLGKAWNTIQDELDKCLLVCANCHREIAVGLVSLPP